MAGASNEALLLLASLTMLSCRTPTPIVVQEGGAQDAASVLPPAADAGADASPARAAIARQLHGDCAADAGTMTPSVDLDTWLKEHRARFPRDSSCSGSRAENRCQCNQELRLSDGTLLLVCTIMHEETSYGRRVNTLLHVLDGDALRLVLDAPTGMPGSNFEFIVPEIAFVPEARGDAIVFVERPCRTCPLALEAMAANSGDSTWTKARTAYESVCAIGTAEWRWTGRTLVKNGTRPFGAPAPATTGPGPRRQP